MNGLLEGHLAAVTGGASGIGHAIAAAFAAQGAEVVVLDANAEAAEAVCRDIRDAGRKAHAIALDVRDRAMCAGVAQQVARTMGPVSILVNCAGINRRNPFTADPAAVDQDWDDIMSVNLDGMFNVTHAFLDPLRARRGRVVNIGSIQSFMHVRWPNSVAYTTSKHGVLGLTRALAAELGKDGVRVNAIGPGLIETPLNAEARARNPGVVQGFLEHTPLGRTGQPEDIVGPALFLASDLSGYVTGGIVMADGGYRAI
ncbi:MAG: SDR family NAD(P)-dependent oxidoreductase [Alphaproteobacteria bacterium]